MTGRRWTHRPPLSRLRERGRGSAPKSTALLPAGTARLELDLRIELASAVTQKLVLIMRYLCAILAAGLTALAVQSASRPARAATIERRAGHTLTAVELDRGDTLRFTLARGKTRELTAEDTWAEVVLTNLENTRKGRPGGGTIYRFGCRMRIDGQPMTMIRYVPVQKSFYEPYVVNGVRIWLDGVREIGELFNENHGACVPRKAVRLALQDATLPICTYEAIRPWYPSRTSRLDVHACYNGDDTWMGTYYGADLHGGLDVNMPIGTPLWAPISIDDQFYFNSLAKGHNNNRWRAIRRWPDGARWVLQAHHITRLLVEQRTPLAQGKHYAVAAGVLTGSHAHSHFVFKVGEEGEEILLDPWILFWQIFENNKRRSGTIRAAMAPLDPATTGQPVRLDAAGSRPGVAGSALTCRWTFGDGGCSCATSPTHAYAAPGVYPVTLAVSDGVKLASTTQHVTVSGPAVDSPVLALFAPDEVEFAARPAEAMDEYGEPVAFLPHTLRFVARPAGNRQPGAKTVELVNLGAGELAQARWTIAYAEVEGWARVTRDGEGNAQRLIVGVDAGGLKSRHGVYHALVTVECPGAINSPQVFSIQLTTPPRKPPDEVIVDEGDEACYASPWFWLAPRFHGPWPKGYRDLYLVGGGPESLGGFVRFQPDLAAGRYEVRFVEETPFRPTPQCPADPRLRVRVRHRGGSATVWVEPLKSRTIGTFELNEGRDGYVQIEAVGSRGLVVADAVRFRRIGPQKSPAARKLPDGDAP